MAVLTTKYDMGQRVWRAHTTIEQKQHPCPDCLGTREWEVASPAGGAFKVECPRCAAGYQAERDLSLKYAWAEAAATPLTIGQIKASTEKGDEWDSGNRYMCLETGIGSGSVYPEASLFETEAEALAAAQVKADATNAKADHWIAQQYDKSLKFSDYQLRDARIASADRRRISAEVRIGMLLDDLADAETVEDVRERVERYREGPDQ